MPFSLKSLRSGCASQSSTAICTGASVSRPFHHRVHSYLSDQTKSLAAYRKSFSSKNRFSFDGSANRQHVPARRHSSADVGDYVAPRRKSSADVKDAIRRSSADVRDALRRSSADVRDVLRRKTAGGYSLIDKEELVVERRDTDLLALEWTENVVSEAVKPPLHRSTGSGNGWSGFNQRDIVVTSSQSVKPPPAPSGDQVVVLRVSLHCKGCEGKLRKHLSKMEGVTSFDIEFETKKVTVIGNVTPLYVLNSITKVKNAQFWSSPTTSSTSSSSSSSVSAKSEFSY